MAAIKQDFTIWQGESKPITAYIYDSTGTKRKSLVDASIQWIVKKLIDDEEAVIVKSLDSGITVIDADEGVIEIRLLKTDTISLPAGNYYHEAQISIGNNDYTPFIGNMELMESGFSSLK